MSNKPRKDPSLRRHQTAREKALKLPGRAFVELNDRRQYLGVWDTPEAERRYHTEIAQWIACGRRSKSVPVDYTLCELCADYLTRFVLIHYRQPDGTYSSERNSFGLATKELLALFEQEPAYKFGPLKLKAIRDRLVNAVDDVGRQRYCRSTVNRYIDVIRRMFKWAVAEELIPASTYEALKAVDGLRRGRTPARETERIAPVSIEHVDAVLPHVSRQVAALVRVQLLTGARPGELLRLRPCDLDTTGDVWEIRPTHHKTSHRGRDRVIFIGPQAQAILREFMVRPADAYMFSPREAEAERLTKRHADRETKLSCGNVPGSNRRRRPKVSPGEFYDRHSYGRAIARACEDAKVPHWYPYQLRHTAATAIRGQFGLDGAQVVLGHSRADVTQVYAELDAEKARAVARALG